MITHLDQGTTQDLELDSRRRWRLKPGSSCGELVLPAYDCGAARRVTVQWLAQWTAPLRWKKHPDNPIYGPHKSGAWDSWTNGVSIVPTADGKTYRMYYAGKTGEGIGFAEASVDDPVTWREHPTSPVLKPWADNWEGNQINQPRVVAVTDTHWRMYYRLWFCGNGYGSVGYAQGTPETGVNLFARIDAADWRPITRGQRIDVRRHLQVRAELWSRNPALSPTLNQITI